MRLWEELDTLSSMCTMLRTDFYVLAVHGRNCLRYTNGSSLQKEVCAARYGTSIICYNSTRAKA